MGSEMCIRDRTYPDYNFTAHPMLEQMFSVGFTERLQDALVEMVDPNLLAAFPRRRIIKATDADFSTIEELARKLRFIRP